MTTPDPGRPTLAALARRHLGRVARRVGVTPEKADRVLGQRLRIAAQVEHLVRAQERLEAYVDRVKEEQAVQTADLHDLLATARSLLHELRPEDGPAGAGAALARRLDHGLLHAEAQAEHSRARFARDLADVRSTVRLTQALVDRAFTAEREPHGEDQRPDGTPPRFEHPAPSIDILYRSFEDRHRGDPETVLERQRDDYLELLSGLPNPQLPIADLGCGRGELVTLLEEAGNPAVGVDSNLGQISNTQAGTFHQDDLFRWLDARPDGSCRAVVSMHVVEHLPADLQVRLVFEARRVLADGGALVLETPNTLSLNIAASNFWVDPTHQRPVHPLFLEFLATEAGFSQVETRFLHPIPAAFPSTPQTEALVKDLDSLILGPGDLALVARR
jgi:SAM-dependent methyltransferase